MEIEKRPRTLVFVRHGESEANIVQQGDKTGDSSGFTQEFRDKATADMALTERGMEQAGIAGEWIRKNIQSGVFDAYYVSSFVRARQTAGLLDLPEGRTEQIWKIRDYLREQSWGHLDGMPENERHERFPEIMSTKKRDRDYWPGFGGESMADLVFRARAGIIDSVYRDVVGGSAIVVSHGNTMWAARIILEGLTFDAYHQIDNRNNPLDKMNNCQILQYTRVDPNDLSGATVTDNFSWMRTVCPWDLTRSRNEWQKITRPKYTNADLLEI